MRPNLVQQPWITRPTAIVTLPVIALVYVILLAWFTGSASAYVTGGNWGKATATYKVYFPENRTSGPFPSSTYDHAVGAANKWSKGSTGRNFTLLNYTYHTGPAEISISGTSFSAKGWAYAPGATLTYKASSGLISAGQLYLNSDWQWNTNCQLAYNGVADTRVILLHEVGHLLRLDHDQWHEEAVMWPDYRCKLTLTTDDLNGVRELYPYAP